MPRCRRQGVVHGAARFVRACSDERPFVLALDEVDAIDDQVLGIVKAIRRAQLPVIVVLAGNDPQLQQGAAMPSWLESARRELEPLNEEELGRIADELVALPVTVKQRVVRQAGGNPKRLFDLLYGMRRNGEVIPAAPKWLQAPTGWVPVDASASGLYEMSSIDLSIAIDDDIF